LALIGKRGSVQEPPKVKICPKLWFLATGSRHNEHIQTKPENDFKLFKLINTVYLGNKKITSSGIP